MSARGRLAPSPTGDLHLGGAATFLVAWLEARRQDGALILRMEDLDTPRVAFGAAERILDDLRWLGLGWDEGPDVGGPHAPYLQSERTARYAAALAALITRGHTYLCDCSRAEIARVASAPHEGEEMRYPGTCREHGMRERPFRRPPAVRFAVPEHAEVRFRDGVHGVIVERVHEVRGDFVLRRGDGMFAYQLAVVVDDLEMKIDHVVRGADLLSSTARQILIARALGAEPPSYLHAPLVLGNGGARLAKRSHGVPVRDHRATRSAAEMLGLLAHAIGIADDDAPRSARELLGGYEPARLSLAPVCAPGSLLGAI